METNQSTSVQGKSPIEALSKTEIIEKYKGLLGIAKKAKQAKDELTEENRKLKEALARCETQKDADKNALITMKEMVDEFTQNKLQLTTQLDALQKKNRIDNELLEQFRIENESLKRQLDRLNDDNDVLLKDIDQMEGQLKQVNLLGVEQKEHLTLLELEVNKLKEAESLNNSLQNQVIVYTEENKALKEQQNVINKSLSDLKQKYQNLKETNAEQRNKFNALKDRFVDIYRKLKKLKECKRILLETQYEYSEAVSNWQKEIIEASKRLCVQFNALKSENQSLLEKLRNHEVLVASTTTGNYENNTNIIDKFGAQMKELKTYIDRATIEYNEKIALLKAAEEDNANLNRKLLEYKNLIEKINVESKNAVKLSNINLIELFLTRINELQMFVEKATIEHKQQSKLLRASEEENVSLKQTLKEHENIIEKNRFKEDTIVNESQPNLNIEIKPDNLPVEFPKTEEKNLTNANEKLLEVKKELEAEVLSLKALLNEYEKKDERFHIVQQEMETLNSKAVHDIKLIETLEKENKILLDKLNELAIIKEERTKLEEHLEILLQKNEDNLNKLELLNSDKEELCHQVKKLNELLEENKLLKDELQHTRDMLKILDNERICLIQQNESESTIQDKKLKTEELDKLNAKLLNYSQTIEDLQLRYERKEREHADLLGEMREINEALKARGDVISRQQESHSELITEIKQTTLKLQQVEQELNKKEQTIQAKELQIQEIRAEVNKAREKIADLECSSLKNEEKIRQLSEEVQQLHHNVQDNQSEILSTSTISRAEELNRLREVDESFEEKYNKLRGLAVKLKKKLQDQTAYIAELENQQTKNNELNTDMSETNKKMESLQMELEESKKELETHKIEIQKLKLSRKQANVLNLEIEAAEKSLSEATNKLAIKINEVETLTESLASKENTILQLKKEIVILEAAKEAECTHSKELKEQIDLLQKQIKDAVHSKQIALDQSKDLEQSCEGLKLELEETRLQLANIASQHEAALAVVITEKQNLEVELIALQTEHQDTLMKLKTEERVLEDLRIEYLDYKVKAQAVLRKNQNKDCTLEREQKEELISLKASEKQLQINVGLCQKRLEDCCRENELLKEENNNLQRRSKELMQLVNDLKQQNETIAQEQRHQMLQHQESLKQHRLQLENLDASHKLQAKEIELSYLKEIEELKTELSKAVRQPPVVGAVAAKSASNLSHNNPYISSEQSKIDFLLMEREDAEGSEEAAEALATAAANRKISTSSRRSLHDFMPLDELLNSPMNVISDSVTTITSTGFGRGEADNSHVELQATKELLQKQESRVRHLTALLAENEQDLAKLTQMNDMLKEELRRQERAEEREKHLHNLEYLKNVVIKFCTLNNSDERTRLVPVLNTILKLSRSETEMLSCAAKGQKATTDANSNRGWGNFLPTWGNSN